MPRGRAWRRASGLDPDEAARSASFAPPWEPRSPSPRSEHGRGKKTDGVLRPDAAIFEVIGKPCGQDPFALL